MTRFASRPAVLIAFMAALVSACANSPTIDSLGHTKQIGWYVVDAHTDAPAKLEMRLDGKSFHSDSTPGLQRRAETTQDYVPGKHVLEVIVVGTDLEAVTLSVWAHHKPTQASEYRHVTLDPQVLRTGERVSITFED